MGLLDKLFKRKNKIAHFAELTKTAQILDEDLYWDIVQESLDNTDDQEDQEAYLIDRLQELTPSEIIGFRLLTDKLLYDLYNSETWCAAYIMNEGCSDDSFEYFRCWVVSRGKAAYYNTFENPDTLIEQIDEEFDYYDFEGYLYIAVEAFKNKTGKELYDYIDYDRVNYREGQNPEIEFNWHEEDPQSLRTICPVLYDKMYK